MREARKEKDREKKEKEKATDRKTDRWVDEQRKMERQLNRQTYRDIGPSLLLFTDPMTDDHNLPKSKPTSFYCRALV